MRITVVMGFFLPVPPLAGGATEKIWHRLAGEFERAGHDVTIVSRTWAGLPDREQSGRLAHRRIAGWNHTRRLPLNLWRDFRWGLRVARALPPGDVVVCNTVSLPLFLRDLRPDAGRVAVVLGRMPKGQVRVYRNVDLLLATSEAVADKARAENPDLAPRVTVFPNPIDWALHAQANDRSRNGQPVTLGYVGRLHREKGLELLLGAATRLRAEPSLPPWRLQLVGPVDIAEGGSGPGYVQELKDQFGSTLGDRWRILPPEYDRTQLARIYGQLDIFCYPSLAAQGEGLSIAPLEAMAAGAVPVVSDLDCYRDVLRPGGNGFRFNHRSRQPEAELAEILSRLIADPALRRRLSAQAQSDVGRYDFAPSARALIQSFARLTPGPIAS